MIKKIDRQAVRKRKQLSIRNKISGTSERPRLSVYRSNSNIFAQLIDDVNGVTITSASTLNKEISNEISHGGNIASAKIVGKSIAEKAMAAGITHVIFDRSGYKYTGRISALADSAREAGLKF